MTPREQFLMLFHISDFLAQRMEDYRGVVKILCKMERMPERGEDYGEQFIHGVAGVISCLMRGGDEEVVRGIEFIRTHLCEKDRYPLTSDPIQFYCNKKAMLAISRPYFYCYSDMDLHICILHERYMYPGLPVDFYPYGFWYWIGDALKAYGAKPDGYAPDKGIDEWVDDSFPRPGVHRFWLSDYRYQVRSYSTKERIYKKSLLYTLPPMSCVDTDIQQRMESSYQYYSQFYPGE